MDLDDLIQIARARWRTALLLFLACMATCVAYLIVTPSTYQSTAKVFISVEATSDGTVDYNSSFFLSGQVSSYAGLVSTDKITSQVANELKLGPGVDLSHKLSAAVESQTVVIDVSAVDGQPVMAQKLAQTAAEKLATTVVGLQKGLRATITNTATLPVKPVSPTKGLDLVVAALIGILLGIGGAILRDRLDKTVRTEKQVEHATGAPVLAAVINDPQAADKPLLSDIGEFASRAEAFRLLRTNLQFVDLDRPPRIFVVTSAVAAEGKTQTSTNLAISMAKAGHRTLLVDGDLRRPMAAQVLGLDPSIGLTTVLTGQVELSRAIQIHPDSGLHLLASGKRPPNPTEVLQTQATRDLLAALHDAYDAVIIDAPPLLPVADPAVLANAADGVIIVTRHGATTVQQLEVAASRLHSVGARIFGVVLNMVPRPDPGAYAYYMEYAPVTRAPKPEKPAKLSRAERHKG